VLTSTHFYDLSKLAKPILVAYESGDEQVLAEAQRAAASTDAPPSTTRLDITPSSNSSSSSLSGGAIAGIAIGSGIGGIILATALTFLFLRMCLGYRKMPRDSYGQLQGEEKRHRGGNPGELDSHGQINELDAWPRGAELDSTKHNNGIAEAPGHKPMT
jgi:hypothetical protein